MDKITKIIKEELIKELELELAVDEILDEDFLLAGGYNLDSIKIIEMVVSLEEIFDIYFDDDELSIETFRTIKNIAKIVNKKIEQKEK